MTGPISGTSEDLTHAVNRDGILPPRAGHLAMDDAEF